jgi:autotransporter translocation and assembly factor TamB
MRIKAHFRIRGLVQDLARRVRRMAVALIVLVLLAGSLVVGRNVFMGEVKSALRKSLDYGAVRLAYFPPALILDDVRSRTTPDLFRVRRVRVELPFLSLLRNEKAVTVFLEGPEVHLRPELFRRGKTPGPALTLPVTISRGLVRDGAVTYESPGGRVEIRDLKALVTEEADRYALRAEAGRAVFTSFTRNVAIGGALSVLLSGIGEEIKVDHLTLEGPQVKLKAEGRVRGLADPEIDLAARFEARMPEVAAFFEIPFTWQGQVGGQGSFTRTLGAAAFNADLSADDLSLGGVPLGRLEGRLTVRPGAGSVSVSYGRPGRAAESVVVTFGQDRVDGDVRGVFLDPLMKDLAIAWPVTTPAWGQFSVAGGLVEGKAEFRAETLERTGDAFSIQGNASVRYDPAAKTVLITTPDLRTSFARVEANSLIRIDADTDTVIRGSILDLKQAREFVQIILDETFEFPEIRGAGIADIRLTGSLLSPRVSFTGAFSPAGFDLFEAASAEGEGVIQDETFQAKFHVEDPDLKGDIRVSVDPRTTEASVENGEGDLSVILPALRIPVDLRGRASGDFQFSLTVPHGAGGERAGAVVPLGEEDVSGTFSSPEVVGFGQVFKNVKGRLEWRAGTLSFPEISTDLYGGRVYGRVSVGLESRAFDADMRAENVQLALLVPGTSGVISIDLAGKGAFGPDRLSGRFAIADLMAAPLQRTEVKGNVSLDYSRDELAVDANAVFLPGDNEARALVKVPLGEGALSGAINGHWTNLDLLLPWTGAKGRADFSLDLAGTKAAPSVSGAVTFQGPLMPFPRFAQALTDYSGTLQLQNGRISVDNLKAQLGGGDVTGSGEMVVGRKGVETIDLTFAGKNMLVAPLERTRALVDGDARLIKDSRQFVLDGDFSIKRLTWRREIYEKFGFSSQAIYSPNREPSFFDDMTLNIRLRATDNAIMDNSLGKVTCRFDLSITGDIYDPVLLGDIEFLRGSVNFQDRSFRIVNGRLGFFNPAGVEPYLDLKAETYVKDYRVTMALSGLTSHLRPEFTSSPPMPPEDVLALLALGEAFRRTYAYSPEQTTTLSTASLLSFQIADQAIKRGQGLFTLDRFRIDPFVTGTSSEMTARLTLGKKLSKNLILIYSTNLATQREEIYRMEWEIKNEFSLVGLRDELGRISFDLKYRKRF